VAIGRNFLAIRLPGVKNPALLPVVLLTALISGCAGTDDGLDLSMYQYRETRDLVRFVYHAACSIETGGNTAIDAFRADREGCCREDQYLYVYDLSATCIFHAGMPYLEGTNLRDITDVDGKRVFDMIFQALEDPGNPHGWVHYSWWEPGSFYPVPKSSCHFRVTTPEGVELIVGGGINYPHEEREFARIIVDGAVDLIEREGTAAIDSIDDPLSRFNYRDVRVFAFRPDNDIVISPIVADSMMRINLLEAVDRAGNRPFALAVRQLESGDRVWQVFLARNRYERQLVKKVLYLRKTELDGSTLYVGAITDLPMMP
jgi:hypothetical protein